LGSKRNKNRNAQTTHTQSPRAEPIAALPISRTSAHSAIAGFVAWAWVALMLVGYIVFRIDGLGLAKGNMLSKPRATFAVVNAATLTGFQTTHLAIDHYNAGGQIMIFLLTIGGTLLALICGGIAVARIAKLPYSDWQITRGAIFAQCIVLIIGGFTLHHVGQPILVALLQAASAFGSSGVWMGDAPGLFDGRTHLILLPLAVLGGLSLPVLMDLIDALRGRRALSQHTMSVLKLSAIVFLVGLLVLFVLRLPDDGKTARKVAASSLIESINTRTAGLPFEFAADFPRYLQWVLIVLMAIGAAPGGTAGGLKVTTIGTLFRGVRETLSVKNPGRIFGMALVWLAAFVSIIFVSLLFLLWTEPGLEADRLLFIVTSAATNCGMAPDRVGIVGTGMYVLSLTMLTGRILPILILWWVVRHSDETDVAIG
jgi:trk system potassium uptake protein TrkH